MKISYSNKIYLDRDIVRCSDISDEAYLAYVAIRFLMTKKAVLYCSLEHLVYIIAFSKSKIGRNGSLYKIDAQLKNKLKKGVEELNDKRYIKIKQSLSNNALVIETENIVVKTTSEMVDYEFDVPSDNDCDYDEPDDNIKVFKQFTMVDLNTVHKIMNINENISKAKLLRYFIVMVSTINYNTKVGWTSIKKMSDWASISNKTAIEFNKILAEHEIVYFEKGQTRHSKESGKFMPDCNTYSLWDNQEQCRERARSHYTRTSKGYRGVKYNNIEKDESTECLWDGDFE